MATDSLKPETPKSDSDSKPTATLIPYQEGQEAHGVFHYITDNLPELVVAVTASSTVQGRPDDLIDSTKIHGAFVGEDCKHSWVRIDFGETYKVNPTHYAITTRQEGNPEGTKVTYLRSWQLQASNDSTDWVVLREHKNDVGLTPATPTVAWTVEMGDEHRKSFRYFQIVMDDKGNTGENDTLCLTAIELFGELEQTDGKKSRLNPAAREFVPAAMRSTPTGPKPKSPMQLNPKPRQDTEGKEQKIGHVTKIAGPNSPGTIKDNIDVYYPFDIKEVVGAKQPKNGDRVTFYVNAAAVGQPSGTLRAESVNVLRRSKTVEQPGLASPTTPLLQNPAIATALQQQQKHFQQLQAQQAQLLAGGLGGPFNPQAFMNWPQVMQEALMRQLQGRNGALPQATGFPLNFGNQMNVHNSLHLLQLQAYLNQQAIALAAAQAQGATNLQTATNLQATTAANLAAVGAGLAGIPNGSPTLTAAPAAPVPPPPTAAPPSTPVTPAPPAFNSAPGTPLVNLPSVQDSLKEFALDSSPFSFEGGSGSVFEPMGGWSGMSGLLAAVNANTFTPPPSVMDDVVSSLLDS